MRGVPRERLAISAAPSEERGTLEDVIEPYHIQQGYLVRTARGRMATSKAYRHLGLRPKAGSPDLFTESDTIPPDDATGG